jgi:hypothetical protein
MQTKNFPWDMDFNLLNGTSWEPFFTKTKPMPPDLADSIQVFYYYQFIVTIIIFCY